MSILLENILKNLCFTVIFLLFISCNKINNRETHKKSNNLSISRTSREETDTSKTQLKRDNKIEIGLNQNIYKTNIWSYKKLSDKYNYKLWILRSGINDSSLKPFEIKIHISNKNDSTYQKIIMKPNFIFPGSFSNSQDVRYYITKINFNKSVCDNYYGDFIVTDFNSDSLEDFAIIRNEGGNGGPEYEYYIQNRNGIFEKNTFLTNIMRYFPYKINKTNKTITNIVHANVNGVNENTYKYDTLNQ